MKRNAKMVLGVMCVGCLLAAIFLSKRQHWDTRVTLPDGVVLEFHSISVGERLAQSLGIDEYFQVRFEHAALPGLKDAEPSLRHPETHSTSPVQIRFRYSLPVDWKWDVYLVDGQGVESKARVFARRDPSRHGVNAPREGWIWVDAYFSRRDFYHLRFRPKTPDYDPWDIPSLPLGTEVKIKNSVKVKGGSETGSSVPIVAKQGQLELLMKSFIRCRQPRDEVQERTCAKFELRHMFKEDMPYVADTDAMTIWDQSGNMMRFQGPASSAGGFIKLWDRDTFMSDDACYRVNVDLYRRSGVPELFSSDEVLHFPKIPAPSIEAVPVGHTVVVGGRKLTLDRVTSSGKGRGELVFTGDLPLLGERLILVDAVDDHGRQLTGSGGAPGEPISNGYAMGTKDQPATEVIFYFELPEDTASISATFAFEKPAGFEFKVAPTFVD